MLAGPAETPARSGTGPFGREPGAREEGCTCVRPNRTGHVPQCPHFAGAIYACEEADKKTITMLARAAGLSIAELERKRLDFRGPKETCGDDVWPGQRRCWCCPFWNRTEETPL